MEKKMSLKVSVSSMDTYKKCPKKYHYTYIIKPKIKKKKWIHTEFGSCAHRMLELFHKKYIDSPFTIKEAAAIMKECYTEALKEFDLDILEGYTWSPEGDISGIPYLRKIMQFYLNEIKANGIPNVIGVEVPYSFMVGKTEVRGFTSPTSPTPNQPIISYCNAAVILHPQTRNLYYRATPYDISTNEFKTRGNSNGMGFPTTIMDLGPRADYLQELVMSDDYDGYVANKLDSSSRIFIFSII
jgi:hypothetical protein